MRKEKKMKGSDMKEKRRKDKDVKGKNPDRKRIENNGRKNTLKEIANKNFPVFVKSLLINSYYKMHNLLLTFSWKNLIFFLLRKFFIFSLHIY